MNKMKKKIVPSILSRKQSEYQKVVRDLEKYTDLIQFDVMDGKFIKNKTFDHKLVSKVKTKAKKEVHLMIYNPLEQADKYAKAGAKVIIFHIEVENDKNKIKKASENLKKKGIILGVGMNPKTPVSKIKPILKYVGKILLMARYPGTKSYPYQPKVMEKVKQLRKMTNKDIEVDGGMNEKTIKQAIKAGANQIVIGSALFKDDNLKGNFKKFYKIIKSA